MSACVDDLGSVLKLGVSIQRRQEPGSSSGHVIMNRAGERANGTIDQ